MSARFNWELAAGLEHQLRPGLSSSVRWSPAMVWATFSRPTMWRWRRRLCTVLHRRPDRRAAARRRRAYPICEFLYDVNPTKLQLRDNVVLDAWVFYGDCPSHWDGVDVSTSARLAHASLWEGASAWGKTTTVQLRRHERRQSEARTWASSGNAISGRDVKFQGCTRCPGAFGTGRYVPEPSGPSIAAAYTASNRTPYRPSNAISPPARPARVRCSLFHPSTTYNSNA